MAFSTERVLLSWVEDLEQGLDELSRSHRKHHQEHLLKDLKHSARGLLALSRSELRHLPGIPPHLLDGETSDIHSQEDIRQLCARIRRVFGPRSDGGAD